MADNKEFFKQVIDKVDVVETIKKYTKLEKLNTRAVDNMADDVSEYWFGRCPYNKECGDTFLISKTYKQFFCFGCHNHGNIIDFLSKIGSMNRLTAARFLSKTNNLIDVECESNLELKKKRTIGS